MSAKRHTSGWTNSTGGISAAKAVLSNLHAKSLIELDPNLEDERATPNSESLEGSAYRISANGLAAIGLESEAEDGPVQGHIDGSAAGSVQSAVVKAGASSATPRAGTKLAEVTGLLKRDEGASIDELTAITGWLAHTTRAALTGLRKRGVVIERAKRNDGATVYRIAPAAPVETSGEVV